jgi:hypothetical protein
MGRGALVSTTVCLHPFSPHPLVFDVVDTGMGVLWRLHHGPSGGRNYTTFPVNANEAESTYSAVFPPHTPGPWGPAPVNPQFPIPLTCRGQHRRVATMTYNSNGDCLCLPHPLV